MSFFVCFCPKDSIQLLRQLQTSFDLWDNIISFAKNHVKPRSLNDIAMVAVFVNISKLSCILIAPMI